jgi:uncharacterized protein YdaU (DUF1376 family)
VNYYNRYPSHYLAATLHLTMEQDGAYGRLMDWYYSNERPIPDSKRTVIGRATTRKERSAIDFVLNEFFDRTEDGTGWIQKRIESELSKATPKIEAARENGKKGGRPPKQKPSGFPEKNPVGFQNETQTEPSAKAPQTPIYIQEQEQEQNHVQQAARSVNRFPEFWAVYPLKKGKAAAERRWRDRKLDAIADRIIADVRLRSSRDRQWLAGYIPHGSTYVNGSGWEDAIEERPTGPPTPRDDSKTMSGIRNLQGLKPDETARLAQERDSGRFVETADTQSRPTARLGCDPTDRRNVA